MELFIGKIEELEKRIDVLEKELPFISQLVGNILQGQTHLMRQLDEFREDVLKLFIGKGGNS